MSNRQSASPIVPSTLPPVPAPERGAVPERVPAAAHLRAALSRDGGGRARRRPHHRDGAAAARLGSDYEGRPADVRGRLRRAHLTHAEQTSDGRYNLVLRGFEKFRIRQEDHQRSYRLAEVDTILETMSEADRSVMRVERRRLETLLVPQPEGRGVDPKMPPSMPDEELVNALAQYLDLEVVEKQALLERDGLVERCRSLIDLLEMKVITARHQWGAGTH